MAGHCHHMLSLPWAPCLACLFLIYIVLNLIFALAYLLGDGAIANARRGAFLDAFFLAWRPCRSQAEVATNAVRQHCYDGRGAGGLMLLAVAAGLMFASFSRPTERLSQSVEKGLCGFQVGGVEPLGEPVVDRLEDGRGIGGTTLVAPHPGKARGGAQFPG